MSINVNANFKLSKKQFLDARQGFNTIAEMAAYPANEIPNGFMTFNNEDGKNYQFLDLNSVDPTLGQWREFTSGGNCIDDTLTSSSTKTYSIDMIKQLLKSTTGFILVDVLPDLTDPVQLATVDETKFYLVPNPNADATKKDEKLEYICIHIEAHPDIYRTPLVTSQTDYDEFKTEIEDYTTGGGLLTDDYATYTGVKNTTRMTILQHKEMVESLQASDADYTAYDTRVSAIISKPAESESFAWELLGTLGGVSVVFDNFIPNNQIGKVKVGVDLVNTDLLKVVKDMLTIDIPTTITLTGNQATSNTYEIGVDTFSTLDLTATINLGTGTIDVGADIIFKRDGAEVGRAPYVDGTLVYNVTDSKPVNGSTTYTVEVAYNMDGTPASTPAKDTITYKFVYPIFWGVSSTKTIADVTALTKVVSDDKTQKLSYTANNAYCVLAVPDTTSVTFIEDSNGFNNTDSWDTVTQSVTIGGQSVTYSVLTTDMACTCKNFEYTFTLA